MHHINLMFWFQIATSMGPQLTNRKVNKTDLSFDWPLEDDRASPWKNHIVNPLQTSRDQRRGGGVHDPQDPGDHVPPRPLISGFL